MPETALATVETAPEPQSSWLDRYSANRIPTEKRHAIADALARNMPLVHIERQFQTCEGVIKAIAAQDAETIEQRKSKLAAKAFRIADKAYDRVESTIADAPLAQASVVAGIFSEKALLLAGEATQRVEVVLTTADSLYDEMATIKAKLEANSVVDADFKQLPA